MKKFLAILLIVASIFSLAACGGSESPTADISGTTPSHPFTMPTLTPTEPTEPTTVPTEPPTEAPTEPTTSQDIPCESIMISNQTIEFTNKGDTWSIQVRTTPANTTDTITFTSNDPSVATIDQTGLITALSSGKAMITVTCGSITQTCYIECNFYTTPSPTQKPTQAPTQKPTQKPTESDHIHDMVLRTTIIEATHDKEGLDEVRCSWCSHTIQEKTPKISVPYLVGIELVNAVRPNACYLSDGTPILEKIYGTNYCQVGDVLTYKVIMSDGSNEGFTVKNELPMVADMEVNGNLITVTVTDQRFANDAFQIDVISNDMDNNWTSKGIFTYIVLGNIKFTDLDPDDIFIEVKNYAVNQGMESNAFLLNQFNDGTLTSYTDGDPFKSITGTAQYGFDDYIIVEEHENWLEMLFELIDEYKSRGFTKVYMYYAFGAFEFKAC